MAWRNGWLLRAALRLVPAQWRESVREDLREEAGARPLAGPWCAAEAAGVGISLHWVFTRDAMMSDLHYAIRSMLHARWFTVGAVATFALGIGVNVAVFSAVDRMLFQRLPYGNGNRIVLLEEFNRSSGQQHGTLPAPIVTYARQRIPAITAVATLDNAFSTSIWTTSEPGDAPPVNLTPATFQTLTVCGVSPVLGRDFTEDDARTKRKVALLAYETWQRRFAGARDILTTPFYLGGGRVEIVGVLPKGFIPPGQSLNPSTEGLLLDPDLLMSESPRDRYLTPVLLLAPGASVAAVESAVSAIFEDVRKAEPPPPPGRVPATLGVRLSRVGDVLFHFYLPYLWLVVAAGGLVLLVACANLASLLLARGRSRDHDAALRAALGASTWRLILTTVFESAIVCLAGSAVAWLTLLWTSRMLGRVLPPVFARYAADAADVRVVLFALGVACLSSVVAGILPGLRLARVDVLSVLQRGGAHGRSGRRRAGRALLLVEAALGVFLVAGAAVTIRNFVGLTRTDLGFVPDDVYSVNVRMPGPPDPATAYAIGEQSLDALRHFPGVQTATAGEVFFIAGSMVGPISSDLGPQGARWLVQDDYFDTFRIPVRAGRTFTAADIQAHANVAVLSERAARLIWPDAPPSSVVGRIWRSTGDPDREIVGVVGDFQDAYESAPQPSAYIPLTDQKFRRMMFAVRMAPGTPLSLSAIRQAVRERVGASATVTIAAVGARVNLGLLNPRFRAVLFGTFAIVALLIAAVGLYAVSAFDVALRQRELGVRLSLGASARQIQRMVVAETVAPVVLGVAAGLAGAWWAATFIQTFLVRTDARDPWTLALVASVLVATAAIAAWLPARRAARVDPAVVLRAQ